MSGLRLPSVVRASSRLQHEERRCLRDQRRRRPASGAGATCLHESSPGAIAQCLPGEHSSTPTLGPIRTGMDWQDRRRLACRAIPRRLERLRKPTTGCATS